MKKQKREPLPLSIGSKLYWQDTNRRVYQKHPESGRPMGSPDWRAQWREVEVKGETPRMWLLSLAGAPKVPKAGPLPESISLDEKGIEQRHWAEKHRYRISSAVERVPLGQLFAVAEAIDYEPKAPK